MGILAGGTLTALVGGWTAVHAHVIDARVLSAEGGATMETFSAGYEHTCAVDTTGQLYCWGAGGHTPQPVSGMSSTVSVSAGQDHTCAIDADALLWCWGSNDKGQLGDGGTTASSVPKKVNVDEHLVKQVSAGNRCTCAVTTDGKLYCWGTNSFGQLGIGTTSTREKLPQHVESLQSVKYVTASLSLYMDEGHVCALTDPSGGDDEGYLLYCWGNAGYGQVGFDDDPGMMGWISPRTSPVLVGINVGLVHSTWRKTLAVDRFGRLFAWGELTPFDSRTRIYHPRRVDGISDVTSIAGGEFHQCATVTNGTLYCWGSSGYLGVLGHGDADARTSPTEVDGMVDVAMLASGYRHTCAATFAGHLFCWGSNKKGQLGSDTGASDHSSRPVQVADLQLPTPGALPPWDVKPSAPKFDRAAYVDALRHSKRYRRGLFGYTGRTQYLQGTGNGRTFQHAISSWQARPDSIYAIRRHTMAILDDGSAHFVWSNNVGTASFSASFTDLGFPESHFVFVDGVHLLDSDELYLDSDTTTVPGLLLACALSAEGRLWCGNCTFEEVHPDGYPVDQCSVRELTGVSGSGAVLPQNVSSFAVGGRELDRNRYDVFSAPVCAVLHDSTLWCWEEGAVPAVPARRVRIGSDVENVFLKTTTTEISTTLLCATMMDGSIMFGNLESNMSIVGLQNVSALHDDLRDAVHIELSLVGSWPVWTPTLKILHPSGRLWTYEVRDDSTPLIIVPMDAGISPEVPPQSVSSTLGTKYMVGAGGGTLYEQNSDGLYSPSLLISHMASPCRLGTYNPILWPALCVSCDRGFLCMEGAVGATPCPAGSYCPDYSTQLSCSLGSFCAEGSYEPAICPLGSYCETSASIAPCVTPGSYCAAGSSAIGTCEAGSYCVDASSSSPCDLGNYCPAGRSSDNVPCASGSYCPTPGAQIQCTAGNYCPAASTAVLPCELGNYCAAGSSSDEVLCAGGSYCPTPREQIQCPTGHYCPEGSVAALPCPEGTNCPAGSNALPEGVGCPAGSYCPDPKDLTTAIACKSGNYCPAGSTSDNRTCALGWYCPSPEQQFLCAEAGTYCPEGSVSNLGLCPAGSYCETPATIARCSPATYCEAGRTSAGGLCPAGFVCPTPASRVACKDGNLCVVGSTVDDVECAAGNHCPGAAEQVVCTLPGQYCPAGTGDDNLCPDGYYCAIPVGDPVECSKGNYCPAGTAADDTLCEAGSYCPTPSEQLLCPSGSYCKAGVTQATQCTAGSNCPAGSTTDPGRPPFRASMFMTGIAPDEFLGDAGLLDGLRGAVAAALGGTVAASDVSIDCACPGSCAVSAGESPEGKACGLEVLALGRRKLLQDAPAEMEVEFSVEAADAETRQAFEERMASTEAQTLFQDNLIAGGFSPDVARSSSVTVVDTSASADVVIVNGFSAEDELSMVVVAVLVAVPTAMVVVALAVYQNNKKAKPVKLSGLVVSVVFSWYDFMSDVWFGIAPAQDPQWAIFPLLGLIVVILSTLIGAGVVTWVLRNHSVDEERWGMVDRVTAVLAATNLELLPLLPWAETSYEGLPSKTVATVPTVTLFVEDLPQLFIQGLYLVLSRDIGNYVVIVSVALSGASLLLRFAKAAMHMLRQMGDAKSRLAETSPMREWDPQQFAQWVEASMSEAEVGSELYTGYKSILSWNPARLLELVDAVFNYQATFEENGEEDTAEREGEGEGDSDSVECMDVEDMGSLDSTRESGPKRQNQRKFEPTAGEAAEVSHTVAWEVL